MAIFKADERSFAESISNLIYCNIYLPERIDYERQALGDMFVDQREPWNIRDHVPTDPPNVTRISHRVDELLAGLGPRIEQGADWAAGECDLYVDMILLRLYYRWRTSFDQTIIDGIASPAARRRALGFYGEFESEAGGFLEICDETRKLKQDLPHWFALFFQVRRAYFNISNHIIGRSQAAIQLRAEAWQSIFTHDMRRYRRSLYPRMADFATLILGPSGTGKELVARAVGLSRYIPFDPKTRTFTEDFAGSFYTVNLSALSPTLIESELFGHKRGSFTGAVADREGWLEVCPPLGSVFLDEIGELDPTIQVKLLRVLQTRTFQRLGETEERSFQGKIIAATNQDLNALIADGRFREDLYYRLCSDIIVAPSLRERLAEEPDELPTLLTFLARGLVGEEAASLAAETQSWIENEMGADYEWPGNIRELEQCLRNILIRKAYQPRHRPAGDPAEQILEDMRAAAITADELVGRYCTFVYAQTNNYEEVARRLNLDRRTVKAKLDQDLLEKLRNK